MKKTFLKRLSTFATVALCFGAFATQSMAQMALPKPTPAQQNTPTFDFNANIGYHVLGAHLSTDASGTEKTDDELRSLIGPASTFIVVGTYNNKSVTIGLRPFDQYIVNRAYATYHFNEEAKLDIGLAPSEVFYTFGSVLNGKQMEGYGNIKASTKISARLHYKNFTFALVDGSMNNISSTAQAASWIPRDSARAYFTNAAITTNNGITWVKRAIPRIEATYNIKASSFSGKVYGQYGAYFFDVEKNGQSSSNVINTLLLGVGGQYNLNKFVFKGNVYGGMNAGLTDASHLSYSPLYGAAGLDYDVAPGFEADGNEYNIQNTIDYGVSAEIGYKVTPKIIPHVGAGYAMRDNSDKGNSRSGYAAYVNTDIIAYPGVIVTPEIAYYNTTEDTKTKDTETGELLYGVKVLFLIM